MSSTVTYKGSTLTVVNNTTRTLLTSGKWMEADLVITDVTSGGSVTITDEVNATGTTCVIITGQTPTPTPTPSGDIPLNTQLIDFNAISNNALLDPGNGETIEFDWYSVSDYTAIDSSMTFSYIGWGAGSICFYDSSRSFISSMSIQEDSGGEQYAYCTGTLTPAKIPTGAKYVRIDSQNNPDATELSLIRTA